MMYKQYFSRKQSRDFVKKSIESEGYAPLLIRDSAGAVYETHAHAETKLLVCLEGSMTVIAGSESFDFEPGDKLIIPGNQPHSALTGNRGCVYYWSEKQDA